MSYDPIMSKSIQDGLTKLELRRNELWQEYQNQKPSMLKLLRKIIAKIVRCFGNRAPVR